MRNISLLWIITVLWISTLNSGCQTLRNPADAATQAIDKGIADINRNNGMWAEILQRVSGELPEDLNEGIREEARSLAARSIAEAGAPFRCNVDFLGTRAIQGLQRIKGMLAGANTQDPPLPAICLVEPQDVDLSADLSGWETVIIHGYDLDHPDGEENLIGFSLVNNNLSVNQSVPEALINRTTHYQITLNLGELAKTLHAEKISKIAPDWTGNLDGTASGEIVVKPWRPGKENMVVELGKTIFTPPHVSGDHNFLAGPNAAMYGFVSADIEFDEAKIMGHVHMNAVEKSGDKTQAQGESAFILWDQIPPNWKIIRVLPNQSSKRPYFISKPGLHTYDQPEGQIVNRFNVYGDHKGDDAGGSTKVEVDWRPITIEVEETRPAWATAAEESIEVSPEVELPHESKEDPKMLINH